MKFGPEMKRLSRAVKALFRDQGGNFAMMTALVAVPVLLAMGAVLDVGYELTIKHDMQSALDSAVLVGANETPANRDTRAANFYAGNFRSLDQTVPKPAFQTLADGSYHGVASAVVPIPAGLYGEAGSGESRLVN